MSIISGYKKFKKHIKTNEGFQLQSLWTNANTVEANDKRTMQTKVGAINGISSSETANSGEIAASTALTNKMNGSINQLSRDLTYFYGGGAATDLKSYIDTHITAQNVPGGRSPKSFHFRNDNGSVNMIGSAIGIGGDAFIGFFVDFNTADAYSFRRILGADTVLKKLGSPTIKTKTVTGNGSFDAGGKVLFAGIQNAGLHIMTYAQKYGQGSHYSATCSYAGNMITYDQHAYGENTSGTDQYSMTIIYAVE